MAFTQDFRTQRRNYDDGETRIGEKDRLWYDSNTNTIRIGDGETPGGTIVGGGSGGSDYTLPTASSSVKGGVKIGSNITITDGVISVAAPFSGSYNDLTNKPTIPSLTGYATETFVTTRGYLTSVGTISYNDLSNKPTLFSGSYTDLTNKPTLFDGAYASLSGKPTLFSGSYNDLTNKPTIPSLTGYATETYVTTRGYLTTYTETDPVFAASSAAGITSTDISNWGTAYGWGDHASAGYLTSAEEIVKVASEFAAGQPFLSKVIADLTYGVTIETWTGIPQFATSKSWKFGFDGNITFPDSTVQITAYTATAAKGLFSVTTNLASGNGSLSYSNGVFTFTPASVPTTVTVNGTSITLGSSGTVTAAADTLTGTELKSTVVTSSLTSVGTLTSLNSGAITTTGTLAVNAAGGITTNQTTFLLVNTTATTVTAFGAATTINLGYTNSVAFSNTFNIATNAQAFSTKTVNIGTGSSADGSTYVNIGSTLGQSYVTVNGTLTATLTGNASTATKLATARAINGVNFDGSAAITVTADAGTLSGSTLASGVTASSLTSVGTLTGVTSNAATAFIAGAAAESGVALQMPHEGALRNLTNGLTNMYFDVSVGGTAQGQFQFRSSSAFTNVLTMSPTAFNVNTGATVTARTPSLARTAFNSAIDTELTVDEMRFRISNQGGIFPQVIGNTSTRNLAWTVVAARSGSAVTQAGSTGTLVASNAWTSLYTLGGMDSAGDTYTATLQDKALSRIYRITFMRSDNGTTTGYNIIAERLL